MNVETIVAELRAERDRLDSAIRALEGVGGANGNTGKRRGRKPGRHMSAEARARISKAMKARWAKRQKSA